MKTIDINGPTRLVNALRCSKFETIDDIASADASEIAILRNIGDGTLRELAVILLRHFRKPKWLQAVAHRFEFSTEPAEYDKAGARTGPAGWRAITSTYKPSEFWMLCGVVADMERSRCDYKLVLASGGIEICRPCDLVREVEADEAAE